MRFPDLSLERAAWSEGYRLVAGLDEAGRGAWAGPVAAAAVILPADCPDLERRLEGVCDSKLLSPARREALYDVVVREALAVGVAMIDPEVIIHDGIGPANRQAMAEALDKLSQRPDYLLIDYLRLPQVALPQKSIKKGDQKCLSIAAASIIAKVTRDRLMVELAQSYPGYGFERHKGYGTRAHREAIHQRGVLSVHRRSWAPFQDLGPNGAPAEAAEKQVS